MVSLGQEEHFKISLGSKGAAYHLDAGSVVN